MFNIIIDDNYFEKYILELLYGQLCAVKNNLINTADFIWGLRLPKNFNAIKKGIKNIKIIRIIEVLDELNSLKELDVAIFKKELDSLLSIIEGLLNSNKNISSSFCIEIIDENAL